MKKLVIKYDTFSGTGCAVCSFGAIPKEQIVALLGQGKEENHYMDGAGIHSVITTWIVEDGYSKGLIRKACADYKHRRDNFYAKNRISNILLCNWRANRAWAKNQVRKGLCMT